jgi:hypothetical protein
VNDAPVAVPDVNTIAEEGTLNVPATGVLSNDTDEDVPHALTAVLVSGPSHATPSFALNPNGSYTYTPVANYVGTDVFTYQANDGTLSSNIVSVTITITPVNDPPTFTGGGNVTSPEDTPYSAAWATGMSAGPADETGQTLSFNVNNDNNGLFAVQPAIAVDGTLTFTPAPNANGVANVSVTLSDNGGGSNTSPVVNFTITITNVNDAPALTAGGGSATFTEDGAAVAVDPAIAVADLDDTNLESAAVTITNLLDSGAEVLTANTAGTTITANYVAPTLTLTGTDTKAHYQQVLQSVTYANSAQNPNTTTRSISFVVNDGDVNSNTVSKNVTVIAVNDASVLTAGGALNYTENDGPSVVDGSVAITDVDSTTLTGATVQITGNYVNGEDVLTFVPAAGITGNFVVGSGMLTLSGTASISSYQTALRNVLYHNTSDNPSTAPRTVTWQVNDGGAANNLSNQPTSTINVTAVNDAPTVVAGSTRNYAENDPAVTLESALTIVDPDSPMMQSAVVSISGNAQLGTDILACPACGTTVPGISANYLAGSGVLQLTGADTLANYQTALRSVTYASTSEDPSTAQRSIDWFVTDSSAAQSADTAQNATVVNVSKVNDASVITTSAGTTNFTEDGGPVAVDNGLTVTDVDNTTLASATVTITNLVDSGAELLAATTSGTSITANYVAPTLTLTGVDTIANYQTVLRSVTYENLGDTPSTTNRSIDFKVNDGAIDSNTATKAVSVTATNDAPVVTPTGGTSSFTEDGGGIVVDNGITVTDVDSTTLSSAAVTITNLLDAGAEILAANTGGTSITAVYAAPTLTLTGVDSVANYQTVLRSVTYNNTSNNPTTTARSLSFQVNDGALNSNTATKSVTITPVNDASVVTTSGGTTAFTEDAGPVAVDNALTVTDIDNATLVSATVTITNLTDAGAETLAATTGGTSIVANYVAPTLTLTGVDTIANYQAVLRSVTYNNASNTPNVTNRSIAFQVNDGSTNSNTATKTVSVTPTNDAPAVNTGGGTTSFTEAAGAVVVDATVTPSDVDSATLASATVTITNLLDATQETLAASTGGTSIVANYAAPTLTLTGVDSVANYQTVLRSVTYNNASQTPNTTTRSISFQVNDGSLNSNVAAKSVSITAVNSAPTLTAGGGAPSFVEDAGPVVVDSGITPADVDNTTLASATVTITNLLDGGAEFLAANTGGTSIVANYAAPTLTLTGVDSIANYQTVLRSITYNNTSNTPSTTSRSISFKINDGSLDSNITTKSVTIVPTNDAPAVTTTGGTTSFTEGAGAVVVDSGVIAVDVDSATLASATVTITNLLNAGQETLAATTGGTSITAVYAAPVLTLTGVDSVANYQTVLRSVTYNNASNAPSTTARSIAFQVNDGSLNSNVATKSVSITSVNSAPTLTAGGGAPTFVEDGGPVVVDNGVTPADVDSTTLASAVVTITNLVNGGAEFLAANTGGTSITANYAAPTLTLSGVDSLANYQTVLRSITYNNTSDTPNTTARVISFKVNDGSLDSNVTTKSVTIVPTNDAPVVTTTAGNTTFTEAAGAVAIDSGLTATDVDSATLASATVTISNLLNAGQETLAATTGGTSITAVYAAPVLTLTGVDTIANYQTVLRSVTYNNASNAPNATDRSIAFQVNDGALNSNVATKAVTVVSVNSAPTVTTSGGTTAFVEDAGSVIVDALVTPADVDSTTLASAQVVITNLLNGGLETLTATTAGTSIVANYAAPTLTLTGVDTIANYQTVLRSVRYNNSSDTPNTTVRGVSFKVNDGSIDSNVATKAVSITPSNDAPTLATSGGTTPFTEDGGTPFVDTGVTITDPDSPTMASATITISNLLNSGAEFLAADTTGTSITANYVAPVLTLTGVDSLANYQTVLRKVTYNNTSQNPNTTNRTVSFQVNDGAAASNVPTRTVSVTAVNDAPVVTTSVGTSAFVEDAPAVVVDSTVTVTDVDNTTLASAAVSITNLVDVGLETLAANTAGTSIVANYAAPTLTLTGVDSVANYQTVLRSVTYNNASNTPTTTNRSISFKVNDGAIDSNTATKAVSVTAANDAPSLTASGTLSYTENAAPTALNATISITDPDNVNMNSATVTISANFQAGADILGFTTQNGITGNYVAPTLTLTGSATIANYITALQSVTYQNTSDNPTTTARTITYQVNDGTANSNTGTSSVTVTATNDAPTNNPPANPQSVNEDTALLFTGAGNTVSITDPDAQAGNVTVQIVTTNGTTTIVTPVGLTFAPPAGNGTASYSITGTLANVNTSLSTLRFDPTLNFPGAAASGVATVQLITTDNGNTPAPAQGDNDTFNITVNQVNDAPAATNDAFDTVGNTELRVDIGAPTTPTVTTTTAGTNGALNNDSDNPAENNPITVTSIVGCGDLVSPYDCTLASGSLVSMNANGTFTFRPSPTLAAGAPTNDTFQYVITDQPNAGTPLTSTGTVTVHVFDKVWYVKQGGTGNGRSDSPLGSFTGINGAGGAGDSDAPGDYIFVHAGSSITTSIELEANQHLLGEGVGLSIPRSINGGANPLVLVAAGTKPILTSATNTVSITAAVPVEVRGLNLSSSAGNPVDLTSTGAYTGSPTLSISDNLFTTASAEDIDVNAGATGTLGLTIQNNDWVVVGPHSNNGIDVRTTLGTLNLALDNNNNINVAGSGIVLDGSGGGTFTVTDFAGNFVHQNTIGSGMLITSVRFDQTPGGAYNTVSAGTTRVGTVGNGVGAGGIIMTSVTGDLSFTDLDITNDNGAGLRVTSGAAFTVAGTGFRFVVPAGVGTITTVGGPAVDLNTVTTTLPLQTISSTGSATTGFALNTVLGSVTAGSSSSIANITSAAGTAFQVASSNATVTYDGTINTSNGKGVNLTSNTGSTIALTGLLTFSSSTNDAFTATGGGTVTASNTSNTITTTTGRAINVANTNIGAAGLKFQTVNSGTAASGPVNGILLNNTGAAGGLTIIGTGSNTSGGLIQKSSGDGISLTDTKNVSLSFMDVDNNATGGVVGLRVNSITMASCRLRGNTNALAQSGLELIDLSGASTVTSTLVSGSVENNVTVTNNTTTGSITMTNCTAQNNSNASGNIGMLFASANTGNLSATVNNAILNGNRTIALRGDAADSSTLTLNVLGATITPGTAGNPQGNQGVEVASALTSVVNTDIENVNVTGLGNTGINVFAGNSSNVTAIVKNNTVVNTFVSAGASNGFGVRVFQSLNATVSARVESNNVSEVSTDYGILAEASGGSGTMKISMINNTSNTRPGALDAIRIQARDSNTVCARFSGNTVTTAGTGFGLAARQANTAVFKLEGLALGSQNGATTETYLESQNPATSAALIYTLVTTNFTGVASNSCGYP